MKEPDSRYPCLRGRVKRGLLLAAGTAALLLAALGVVLPVLPTVPFLLVAAYCYARSSQRFYRWLVGNRLFGPPLCRYLRGEGVSFGVRLGSVALLWTVILLTVFLAGLPLWARILLLVVAAGVTVHLATLRGGPGGDQRMPES
jgi:uncharacterized membrane protein YbaN (DUF454 family)